MHEYTGDTVRLDGMTDARDIVGDAPDAESNGAAWVGFGFLMTLFIALVLASMWGVL